jgi:hypothetical protein
VKVWLLKTQICAKTAKRQMKSEREAENTRGIQKVI